MSIFTPREVLPFGYRMARIVIFWGMIMITLFFANSFRQKWFIRNVPVVKEIFNEACDLSLIREGDSVNYKGKLKEVTKVKYWSSVDSLEFDF